MGMVCENCGCVFGVCKHHIDSRGSGGSDDPLNIVYLCVYCHDAVHRGYLVVGKRATRAQARKEHWLYYEGRSVKEYLRSLAEARGERPWSSL